MRDRASDIVNGIANNLAFTVVMGSLLVMSFFIGTANITIGITVAIIPIALLMAMAILNNPYWGYVTLLLINYFVITIMRYTGITGLSVVVDILIVVTFVSYMLRIVFLKRERRANPLNSLTLLSFIWFVYCTLELGNPSALTNAWVLSRGLSYYLLVMSIITFTTFKEFRMVNSIIMILSILTLIGVLKALMQKYIGFDGGETKALNDGLAKTHLLLTGTRYFSIYSSAGILGAIMGHAVVVFGILAIHTKSKIKTGYFIFVTIAALYGLIISGTRGALAVPAAGFILFTIISKNFKIIIPSFLLLAFAYVFLAMTTIGQSNSEIRRMRTAFDPNEPSLMVRLNNQKILGEYLADKPFGEGLGLSGVDAQSISERFTTSIATDSWYVKIWVETGVVGLYLHIGILVYIVLYGSYTVLFRIRDPEIKWVLTALLCGVFGILVSSYGNQVLGQFPVVLIVYMSIALVFMGSYFDKEKQAKQNDR